jgi:hypothetical protein
MFARGDYGLWPAWFDFGTGPPLGRRRAMKKLMVVLIFLAAAGGGVYYWLHRATPADQTASTQAPTTEQRAPQDEGTASKPRGPHPMPGDMVDKEQPFFEADYGFSMVVPAGWRVISWTDPVPAEAGKRRPAYKIRLEDPKTHALLDFACYPFTEKSRTAVEEIFISKIEAPVPGYELDIQVDEVVKEGDMRIRKAELRTRNASNAVGLMKTYYYLSNDKLYTFSVIGSEGTFEMQNSPVAKVLDDIKILG